MPRGSGSDAVLQIVIDGTGAAFGNGLSITSGGSTVKGLVINSFGIAQHGIQITNAGGNVIEGNYVGTDVTGTTVTGLRNDIGIYIVGSSGNTVGGSTPAARNLVSGNFHGIRIEPAASPFTPADGNAVLGNYIGTNSDGDAPLGNDFVGVAFRGDNTVVEGNLIFRRGY